MKHTKQRYYFSDYSDEDTHPKPRLRLLPSEPIVIKPKGGKTVRNSLQQMLNICCIGFIR